MCTAIMVAFTTITKFYHNQVRALSLKISGSLGGAKHKKHEKNLNFLKEGNLKIQQK